MCMLTWFGDVLKHVSKEISCGQSVQKETFTIKQQSHIGVCVRRMQWTHVKPQPTGKFIFICFF